MVSPPPEVSRYKVTCPLNVLKQPFSDISHYVGVKTLGVLELQSVEDRLHVLVVQC